VASVGQHANHLHLASERYHPAHHSMFTGWMLFLMPKQQCKSTEGILNTTATAAKIQVKPADV